IPHEPTQILAYIDAGNCPGTESEFLEKGPFVVPEVSWRSITTTSPTFLPGALRGASGLLPGALRAAPTFLPGALRSASGPQHRPRHGVEGRDHVGLVHAAKEGDVGTGCESQAARQRFIRGKGCSVAAKLPLEAGPDHGPGGGDAQGGRPAPLNDPVPAPPEL